MKKLFTFQKDLKSYRYPLVKFAIFLSVILFCIFRRYIYSIPWRWLEIAEAFLCFAAGLISIFCIYISVAEMLNVFENKMSKKSKKSEIFTKNFTAEEIICLADENDIIEIKIKAGNGVLKIGTSSDNNNGSKKFFDKRFFIENKEFYNKEDFSAEVSALSGGGEIAVVSIDGVSAKQLRR